MLSGRTSLGAALTALALSLQNGAAQAQYYDPCGSCGPVAAAPMSCCAPIQPMQTTCYQRIPVTTYAREKQTVEVPHYETAYEDREITVYRPVTSSREVEVPTTTYQNVVEYRTVNKDMGRWVTNYHPVAKCAPCQVDPRPGVIGWMNRTGYSMRSAFVPNYRTSRQYVPSMVTCQVPQTRQVAIQGTRRVTVQDTNMVAERKSERVPVQRLVMRKEEITVMRPTTAYRTVPIGTQTAFGPYYGGSQTAYGAPWYGGTQMAYGYPVIDNTTTRSALAPEPDPISADRTTFKEDGEDSSKTFKRSANGDDDAVRGSGLENTTPLRSDEAPTLQNFGPSTGRESEKAIIPVVYRKQQATATAVAVPAAPSKSSGWRATRKTSDRSVSQSKLDRPSVSMADSTLEK